VIPGNFAKPGGRLDHVERREVAEVASAKSNQGRAVQEVTRILSHFVVGARSADMPDVVRKEAARSFFNWLCCAVGGSRHESLDIALTALRPFAGPLQATILDRAERSDILNAALLNGISGHVFDFDDTHLKTIIYPAWPVAAAILALSGYRQVTGTDFLGALKAAWAVEELSDVADIIRRPRDEEDALSWQRDLPGS
jgi:2-methylcitrate dehydratase PrpD